jgi:hypothetical protein
MGVASTPPASHNSHDPTPRGVITCLRNDMTRTRPEIHASLPGFALIALIALMLAGCASAPPPTGLLNGAAAAIAAAREAGADEYAAVDLGFAEEKLAQARMAMDERDYSEASALAELAELNAEVAAARSRAASGRQEVRRQTEANARLRRELLDDGGRP